MSKNSSKSHGLEEIVFLATSAAELGEVLSSLQPSLTYPLSVSILQKTALTEESESSWANDLDFYGTTSRPN